MKKLLNILLISVSILLLPILIIITIKENSLSDFEKTWLYIIIGYVSIACFFFGVYGFKFKKK